MKLTQDLDSLNVNTDIQTIGQVSSIQLKRGVNDLAIIFHRTQTPVQVGAPGAGEVKFVVKPLFKFDADPIAQVSGFVEPDLTPGNIAYTAKLNTDTELVRDLMFVDGDPDNDVKALDLMAEILWRPTGDSAWVAGNTILLTLNNRVSQDSDVEPVGATSGQLIRMQVIHGGVSTGASPEPGVFLTNDETNVISTTYIDVPARLFGADYGYLFGGTGGAPILPNTRLVLTRYDGVSYLFRIADITDIGGGVRFTVEALNSDGSQTWEAAAAYSLFLLPVAQTPADVGLGNVTNNAQINLADLDIDGTMAANSDTKVPSQLAVVTFVMAVRDGLLNGAGGAYDTLKELADFLVADESAATALASLVDTKAPADSPTFTTQMDLTGTFNISGSILPVTGFSAQLGDGTHVWTNIFTTAISWIGGSGTRNIVTCLSHGNSVDDGLLFASVNFICFNSVASTSGVAIRVDTDFIDGATIGILHARQGDDLAAIPVEARHYRVGGIKVVGAQGAAVADVDTAGLGTGFDSVDMSALNVRLLDIETQLNLLLARMRSHGLIA